MSTQLNTQDQNAKVQALQEGVSSKGESHLASVGVSTTALLSALQEPSGATGDDYSILSFILSEDESEEVQKTQSKQNFNLEQLNTKATAGEDTSDAPGAAPGTGTAGKNAIAESAEMMSLLQNKAQGSLSSELQQEQQVLQDELQAAQKEETLWENFAKDWKAYQDDPNNTNFQKLMTDLEGIYGRNSAKGKEAAAEAAQAQHAWDDEQHWKNESGWDRFKSGQWWDPDDWSDFKDGADGAVEQLVGAAASTPGMFSLALDNMTQMVKDRVTDLTLQIQFIEIIIQIIGGGGNAVVQMQALMNVMMQMGVANNQQSTSRNQIMNNANIIQMTAQETKIDKQLKKVHDSEHHHGLFGFIEDFFKAIVKIITDPVSVFEGIADEVKSIVKDFKEGKIGAAFEKILVDVVLTSLTGGANLLFMGTQFGKDMQNMVKLVVDTAKALVVTVFEALHALVDVIVDGIKGKDTSNCIDDMKKAGDVWKTVIENPELQTVLQIVMVVMIVAACLTGQFYLAAFMTVLFVLSASGALTDMTNAIAKSMGNSAFDKVMADVITILIVTVCSLGVGALGAIGEVAADEAVDAAATAAKEAADSAANSAADSAANASQAVVDETVDGAANAADNAASNAEKEASKLSKILKLLRSPRALSSAVSGMGSSIMDTNFGFDIANASLSKKDKEKYAKWIALAVDIVGAILAAGGGMAMAAQGAAGVDNAISSGAKSIMPKITEALENNSAMLTELASSMQKGALMVGGAASIANGAFKIDQGEMYKKLEELMASMNELNVSSDDLTRGMQHLTSEFQTLTKEQSAINKNAYQAAAGGLEGEIRSLLGQV
jgi:hypothetical protein